MTEDLAKDHRDIIKNYSIDNNFIHINYIDGRKEVLQLSLYNMDKLNDKMVEEALEVIKDYTNDNYIDQINIKEVRIFLSTVVGMLTASAIVELSIGDVNKYRVFSEIFLSIFIPTMIHVFRVKGQQQNYYELKKYEMYINHIDEFKENYLKEATYEGINKKGYVGINNLDRYNYFEVERMVQNLDKVRKRTQE